MRSSCLHYASRVEARKVVLPFSAVWCHAMFLSHGSNFFSEEEFLVIYLRYPVFQDDMEDDECLAEFK